MNLITIQDKISFRYSSLPSIILYQEPYKSKLSDKAKITYMIILDRLKLSAKNNYTNEKGQIFIYLSRKELEQLLNCTDKTVTKIFNELIDMQLIFEERKGIGKPIKIYVNKLKEIFIPVGNFTIINRKKYGCTIGNIPTK